MQALVSCREYRLIGRGAIVRGDSRKWNGGGGEGGRRARKTRVFCTILLLPTAYLGIA